MSWDGQSLGQRPIILPKPEPKLGHDVVERHTRGVPVMATTTPRSSDTISDLKDKATDAFGNAAGRVEEVASRVAGQGREVGENFQEVGGNLQKAIDKSVKDQPMATLAVVAAVGFVLGALWKS